MLARLARRIDAAAHSVDYRHRAFTDSAPVLEKALAQKDEDTQSPDASLNDSQDQPEVPS